MRLYRLASKFLREDSRNGNGPHEALSLSLDVPDINFRKMRKRVLAKRSKADLGEYPEECIAIGECGRREKVEEEEEEEEKK